MDTLRSRVFHIYRFQLVPIAHHQLSVFQSAPNTIDELVSNKNRYFREVLYDLRSFRYRNSDIRHEYTEQRGSIHSLWLAVKRRLTVSKPDFTDEDIDNWPRTIIVLNNDPEVQLIAIEHNRRSFDNTNTVVDIFTDAINAQLEKFGLALYIKPLTSDAVFWDLMTQYQGRVQRVDFEVITPNLARISDELTMNFKEIGKTTNTAKTKISFNSSKNGHLKIDRDNELIKSLADYSSTGGGDIAIKLKNYNKLIRTKDRVEERSIREIEIKGKSLNEVMDVYERLVNDK